MANRRLSPGWGHSAVLERAEVTAASGIRMAILLAVLAGFFAVDHATENRDAPSRSAVTYSVLGSGALAPEPRAVSAASGRAQSVPSSGPVLVPVPVPLALPITGLSVMPLGDLPGWKQTFTEDFSLPLPEGSFPGGYGTKWLSYDGFTDTSKNGDYAQKIISAHEGVLDLSLRSVGGRPLGAAPVPLVHGAWGGQRYGRFSVRMRADALAGYGAGMLLWSDANNWNDGEIDFPESALTQTANGANHCPGNPSTNCYTLKSNAIYPDWHTYTIDWTPNLLSFEIDGAVVGSTATNIPTAAMHWVMQFGTNGIPAANTAGHVFIDWATIYSYAPLTR